MDEESTLDLWLDHRFYTPMKPSKEAHFHIDLFIDPYQSSEEYLMFMGSAEGREFIKFNLIDDISF